MRGHTCSVAATGGAKSLSLRFAAALANGTQGRIMMFFPKKTRDKRAALASCYRDLMARFLKETSVNKRELFPDIDHTQQSLFVRFAISSVLHHLDSVLDTVDSCEESRRGYRDPGLNRTNRGCWVSTSRPVQKAFARQSERPSLPYTSNGLAAEELAISMPCVGG